MRRSWSWRPRPIPARSPSQAPASAPRSISPANCSNRLPNMLHVPFRTSPEAISAVLGRQVDVLFDTVSAVIGQVQGGQLKALAVTGKDRFPAVPDVPAAIESGVVPGYDVTTWYGLFVPRGTPPEIIAKLNKTVNDILKEDAVRERLTKAGVVVQGSTPDAFGKFMAAELVRWSAVREAAGIPQQ